MVRQVLKYIALSLLIASVVSCSSAARFGVPLTSSQLYNCIKTFVDSSGVKSVVLIPDTHTAKPEQYKKINDYLDTLTAHGYVTFNEGAMPSDKYTDTLDIPLVRDVYKLYGPSDPMKLDTLSRKMRKLLGVNLAMKYDKVAERRNRDKASVALLRYGDNDYWIDETYADIIKEYETRFGEIELSPYDLECPLDSDKYKGKEDRKWKSVRANFNNYCNDRIARCILESGFDKIAVVYGYNHIHTLYWFVLPDNGYTLADNPY